jgi:hypothetical protein
VKVNTDAGNDRVTVENVSPAQDESLVGGSDIDTLVNLGVTAGNILELKEI